MFFIGDVHGKFEELSNILSGIPDYEQVVQVGDFGAGFAPLPRMDRSFGFIRGNHDSLEVCRNTRYWIEDGHVYAGGKFMFIGGAESIDKHLRTEGVNWWRDEECSYQQFEGLIDRYAAVKPDIMVTHTAPQEIVESVHGNALKSLTGTALQEMFDIHAPKYWIFGHHHISYRNTRRGCEFIGLDELEVIELRL